MKKYILLLSLILGSIISKAQFLPMGNALQRQISGIDTTFRFSLGAPGFMYVPTVQQVKNLIGSSLTFNNGLTKTGNNVVLGGALSGSVTLQRTNGSSFANIFSLADGGLSYTRQVIPGGISSMAIADSLYGVYSTDGANKYSYIRVSPNEATLYNLTGTAKTGISFSNKAVIYDQLLSKGLYGASNYFRNYNPATDSLLYAQYGGVKKMVDSAKIYYNIKDYGAVGDSLTDNTLAIRKAIAAMVSGNNKVLYIPEGIYLISDTLNISVPCTVLGEGGQHFFDKPSLSYFGGVSKIVQTSFNKSAFSVTAPAVTFDKVAIETNYPNPTKGSAINFINGNSSRVVNCSFFNFYINVHYVNAMEFTMNDCYFRNPVLYNLMLEDIAVPDGGDASFVGNYFYSGQHPDITHVYYKSGGGAKFVNNKFNAGGPGYKNGIVVAGGLASTSILLLTNNSLENYTGTGVKIVPTTDFLNISIQANQFSGLFGADTAIVVNSVHAINGYIGGNIFYNTNVGIYKNLGSGYSIGNNNMTGAITPYLLPGSVNDYGIVGNANVGQSSSSHALTVFGGNTGTGDGSAVSFYNGSDYIGGVGNYSALFGGAYDNRFTLFPELGLTYNVGDFTASGVITASEINTSGNIKIESSTIPGVRFTKTGTADYLFYAGANNTGAGFYDYTLNKDVFTLYDGKAGIDNINPAEKLDVNGTAQALKFKLSALNTAPSSATDSGSIGEIRVTADYIYICTSTNTWVRSALTTW